MTTETDAKVFKASDTGSTFSTYALNQPNANEITKSEVPVVVRKDARKFRERNDLALDKFEYPRNGKEPGLVLIFNQENFSDTDLKPRRGSRRDVNEIILCMQRQGFNIDSNNILTDGSNNDILSKLKTVSEQDLSEQNCLIVFFLTHGDDFNTLHTSSGTIKTSDIWSIFGRCKSMNGKPKMFIFQACKGEGYSTTGNSNSAFVPEESPAIVPFQTFTTNFLVPDMLVVYSTIEGNVSFRNLVTGSWFIQELCKNFSAYGKRDDVVSLLIRTTKCVCGNYFHNEYGVDKKQMPMFVSTLTRKFYLNRNKDRNILLKVIQGNEEILKTLKEIKEQVDKLFLKDEDKKKKK